MKDIYIVKRILNDESISDNAFVVWSALQPLCNNEDLLLSINYIGYLIYGRKPKRKEYDNIQAGFKELIDSGVIQITEQLSQTEYVCNLYALYLKPNTEYFCVIYYDELHKIMNLDVKTDKFKLFRYFVCIVSCFNFSKNIDEIYRGKICGVSVDSICSLIPKTTALRYNDILEENKIIFIFRFDDFLLSDYWGINKIPNAYSRYEHKDLCITFAATYQSTYGYNAYTTRKVKEKEAANYSRSMAQKYNHFQKGKRYDDETIREIYEWAIQYNAESKRKYDEALNQGYKPEEPKYKDVTIFDEYIKEGA